MKKIMLTLCMVVALGVVMTGCSKESFQPKESCIYIQRDGGVTGFTKESGYDQSYYSLDELKSDYVEPAVMEYNSKTADLAFAYADDTKEALPVSIQQLDIKDGEALMKLEYASAADYLAFNENQLGEDAELEIGAVSDAMMESSVKWVSAKDGSPVDGATPLGSEKNYYARIGFATRVQVQGKLVYVSDNVTIQDGNVAVIDGEEPGYIIFKK